MSGPAMPLGASHAAPRSASDSPAAAAPNPPPNPPPNLPPLLQPWAAWLALFPDDLAATLGQLLLRLQPLVGPLRRHAARMAVEPAGVGDIVLRGSYDRLLMSEWALADSVPDEFLRRAANNELLFTGPEPANSETSLRSLALFDAGPAQLGEPRLAHLALFILLARRAELAGAEFRWGILQEPGVLHEAQGAAGLRRLLDARSFAVPDADGLAQWDAVLGNAVQDCWLVGDPLAPYPVQAQSRVLVRRSWLAAELEVELIGRRRSTQITLPLPAPEDGVRLLRRPLDNTRTSASLLSSKAHSLKRAPIFGSAREWLALAMVDGSTNLYQVPDSPQGSPARPRTLAKPAHPHAIIAAGLHRKSFGTVAVHGGALHCAGFPGPIFSAATLALPDPDLFKASTGGLHWASAFYWMQRILDGTVEDLLILGRNGNLVGWTCQRTKKGGPVSTEFRLVARNVIGAIQHGERVLFAVAGKGRTDVYSVSKEQPMREHLYPIMHEGQELLFGEPKTWRGGRGTYALRLDAAHWLVGDATGTDQRIAVAEGDQVLGCARGTRSKLPELICLHAGRTRISSIGAVARHQLLKSAEPIAKASFDPAYRRFAWLGQKSGVLLVRSLDSTEALLRVSTREDQHAD